MNDFDDLDDLLGELRSAATDAELAGETSQVDAMARHHRRQKGHTMFSSRRARVATFVAAGVIGFGGVAAAGPGGPLDLTGSDDTTTTTEAPTTTSEVTTTTSEAPTTTSEVTTTTSEVESDDDALVTRTMIEETAASDDADDATLGDDADPCFGHEPAEFDNHGEFVSKVARNELGFQEIDQRDAARSSCGKDDDDDADEVEVKDEVEDEQFDDSDDHDSDDHDDDSDDDSDDDKPEQSGKPDKPGKPESAGKQGSGSKKHSDD